MSKWIRTDDRVVVIAGNEKGKSGTVINRKNDKVWIQGLNMRKKHVKRSQQNQTAQIIDVEAPIHVSNISYCDEQGKSVSVKVKYRDGGGKDLVYFDKDKEIVLRKIKK